MKSLQMPKKFTLITRGGLKRIVLCKYQDDLRKDRCMLNACNLFNQCYRGEVPMVNAAENIVDQRHEVQVLTNRKANPLAVETYYVAPLADSFGVIEWIPGLVSMKSVIEGQYAKSRAGKKK